MSGAEGPLRIAVAGGSIGGLCVGLALRGAGFDVQVYERVAGPMETRGAGIVVQGELIDLLRTQGAGALPTTRCAVRRYLSPDGGEGKVQRAPQDFTSWEAIYRTLVGCVSQIDRTMSCPTARANVPSANGASQL
jgi:2-polyprenyl-6-methoxyphenol hydroxylase-like FAD-dependent oxidoreductase